jgi:hypothetical protein
MVGVDVDLFEVGYVSPEHVDDRESHAEVVGERHPEASFGSRGREVPFFRQAYGTRLRRLGDPSAQHIAERLGLLDEGIVSTPPSTWKRSVPLMCSESISSA